MTTNKHREAAGGVEDRNINNVQSRAREGMVVVLPVFRGYTVDVRLREFRRVRRVRGGHGPVEFVPFASARGDRLLVAYIASMSEEEVAAFALRL